MKVLLADDDRDQLLLRSMLLSQNGFETLSAGDAASAVELARAHKPNCAVVDLRLPTCECGLQLVRQLKTLDPGMHVFVLTGGDGRALAHAPELALMDAILTKGSGCSILVQKLKGVAAGLRLP